MSPLAQRPGPARPPDPRRVVVGVCELAVSTDLGDVLITYALGSCVAVAAYSQARTAAGLIHYMLPRSAIAPAKALASPGMFADTGVPALFRAMYELGCRKEELVIKVAGGGSLLQGHRAFDIGKANAEVLVPMFKKAGVRVSAWDVGGNASRTVELQVATGAVIIRSRGIETKL